MLLAQSPTNIIRTPAEAMNTKLNQFHRNDNIDDSQQILYHDVCWECFNSQRALNRPNYIPSLLNSILFEQTKNSLPGLINVIDLRDKQADTYHADSSSIKSDFCSSLGTLRFMNPHLAILGQILT